MDYSYIMRRIVLLVTLMFAWQTFAFSAITVGNKSNTTGVSQEAVTSQTWSHTVAVASNELCVMCGITDDTDASPSIGIDSITYNSVALTKRVEINSVSGGTDPETHIWTLDGPSTGANNIVVSYASGNTMKVAMCHAIDFGGVDQGTSQDTAAVSSADAGGGTVTQAIVTATNGAMIVSATHCKVVGTAVVDASQTEIYETEVDGVTNDGELSSSYESKVTAGSDTQSFTGFGADDATIGVIALRPSTTAIKTVNDLAKASVKTVNNLAISSVKSIKGLE